MMQTGFEKVSKKDFIGIPCLSGSTDELNIKDGADYLQLFGYNIKFADNIFLQKRYLCGEDHLRVSGFHELLTNEQVKFMIFARGGYGVLRILDAIDFSLFEKNKKPLMGYSDNSIILNVIYENCCVKSFHCSNLSEIKKIDKSKLISLFDGDILPKISSNPLFLVKGCARGILKGGNLTSLASLCGTKYAIDGSDSILFLEDINEPPYKIDRALNQLKLSGCFNNLKGLICGDFTGCVNIDMIYEIITEYFHDIPVAVIGGYGHGEKNNPLMIGGRVVMDCSKNEIFYE